MIFGEAFLELKGSKGMMLHFPKKMRSSSEPQNPQNHRVDFCEMSAFWKVFVGWKGKMHTFYTQKEDPGILYTYIYIYTDLFSQQIDWRFLLPMFFVRLHFELPMCPIWKSQESPTKSSKFGDPPVKPPMRSGKYWKGAKWDRHNKGQFFWRFSNPSKKNFFIFCFREKNGLINSCVICPCKMQDQWTGGIT